MRLHLVGLPHTETTRTWSTCAYTQKIVKFGKMMALAGHELVLYSSERNETPCADHVPLVTAVERERWFGAHDPNDIWANVKWDAEDLPWVVMNHRAAAEIALRAEPRDLILFATGTPQQPIADALPKITACEPFVGYSGISTKYRAFESHYWRATVYGRQHLTTGSWYDEVIPNFFDPDDFALAPKHADPYLLFVGRLNRDKGILTARDIAQRAELRLVVAGPGMRSYDNGRLETWQGAVLDDVEYLGPIGIEDRARVMAEATALLAPSEFIEPFGGVAVEAMLSGTPAITTDWGAFTETVENGVTGFRFRTLDEAVAAVRDARLLDPVAVRARALERYSLAAVAPLFTAWFERLDGLHEGGWYGTS